MRPIQQLDRFQQSSSFSKRPSLSFWHIKYDVTKELLLLLPHCLPFFSFFSSLHLITVENKQTKKKIPDYIFNNNGTRKDETKKCDASSYLGSFIFLSCVTTTQRISTVQQLNSQEEKKNGKGEKGMLPIFVFLFLSVYLPFIAHSLKIVSKFFVF